MIWDQKGTSGSVPKGYGWFGTECDVPQSTAQYMEPTQHGDQNVLRISTKVHVFHRTGQTDRALYWTVSHASGRALWLEPWPDDQFNYTEHCLHGPVFHSKTSGRDRITFGRTNSSPVHCYSFLDCTARTVGTSGLELQHYPRPDDQIVRTGARRSRTDLHFKINGQDITEFGRVGLEIVRILHFWLVRTVLAAYWPCPQDMLQDTTNLDVGR